MTWKLYDVLGVQKGTSKDDIKRAYKKKALDTHPDRGGDPELFKEVNNAYSVLNDDDTRRRYDQLGDQGFEASGGANGGGGGGMHMDPNDIFRQFFGGGGPSGGFNFHFGGHGGHERQNAKRNDHRHVYKISMHDAYTGVKRVIRIVVHKSCLQCKKTCYACQGQGQITEMHRMGFFTQMMQRDCDQCSGTGMVSSNNGGCKECNGNGNYKQEKIVDIDVPAGVDTGHVFVLEGLGEQPQKHGEVAGNLHIEILVQPDGRFTRNGNDLHMKIPITFKESVVGKKIDVGHVVGTFEINTVEFGVLQPSKQYVVKGKGMPVKNKKEYGNMIIEFDIKYPSGTISPDNASKIATLFEEVGIA